MKIIETHARNRIDTIHILVVKLPPYIYYWLIAILWCMGQGKDYEKNVECKSPTETVEATDLKAVYQAK